MAPSSTTSTACRPYLGNKCRRALPAAAQPRPIRRSNKLFQTNNGCVPILDDNTQCLAADGRMARFLPEFDGALIGGWQRDLHIASRARWIDHPEISSPGTLMQSGFDRGVAGFHLLVNATP